MICEVAAWRKISVSRTVGMRSETMMSASTAPGPTEGNWSTSPTRRTAALSGMARSNCDIKATSTIETSSTMTTSARSGFVCVCTKPIEVRSNSNNRWMVLASRPVVSVRRFAARPVGAHSRTSIFLAWRICRILVTMVVLPTPGPPVITMTLLPRTMATASRCEGESVRPVLCSTQGRAFTGSIQPQGGPPLRSRRR